MSTNQIASDESAQVRCSKCGRLLAKNNSSGHFEIKCSRCGALNSVFESMVRQVVVTDANARVLYINKAVEEVSGFTTDEAIGKTPSELWGGHMECSFYHDLWTRIREEKKTIRAQFSNKSKSGNSYDVDVTISPILDEAGEALFYVCIETTGSAKVKT